MDEDYRRTKYCPDLSGIIDRKKEVEKRIKKDHMKAEDMHTYLSNNEASYKRDFIEAYNGKCAYCGISIQLVPKDYFEIDHFIYKKSSKFETKKMQGV